MRRRDFLALLGRGTIASNLWPLSARAQQPAPPVIGLLSTQSARESAPLMDAFRGGLEGAGYVVGRNVLIEYDWAENHYERLPALAQDLVRRPASVIVATGGSVAALTAKAATTTIPIVFQIGIDPVAAGLVASLNRPGGNLTGVTGLGNELGPKRMELLKEAVPAATTFGVLTNPENPTSRIDISTAQEVGRTLGLNIDVLRASSDSELSSVFAALAPSSIGGVVVSPDGYFLTRAELIAGLALRHRVPAIFQYRGFAAAGGLMSYGSSITDQYRQIGKYAGRILAGEKPADLPVVQGTKVELFLNLKTAKAMGIDFPITLLGRADEVIE